MVGILRVVDGALYRAERAAAGGLFLLMALVMFASVTHRVFSREEGRLSGAVLGLLQGAGVGADPAFIHGPFSTGLNLVLGALVAYAALRTAKGTEGWSRGRAAGAAVVLALALAVVIQGLLVLLPNGIVWGPVFALCCMLWVSFLGASMATYEKRHLALEMGEKLWPAAWLPWVRATGMLVTAAFIGFLVALSVTSLKDHYAGWVVNHLSGNLLPTSIPKWAVFLIFPYTFTVMTARFLGVAVGAARGGEISAEMIPGMPAEGPGEPSS